MIDTDALEEQFEKKCLAAGLIKLDEPVDTEDCLNIASKIDDMELFNTCWWQPAMHAMMIAISEGFEGAFHSIDVTIDKDNIFSFSVSR